MSCTPGPRPVHPSQDSMPALYTPVPVPNAADTTSLLGQTHLQGVCEYLFTLSRLFLLPFWAGKGKQDGAYAATIMIRLERSSMRFNVRCATPRLSQLVSELVQISKQGRKTCPYHPQQHRTLSAKRALVSGANYVELCWFTPVLGNLVHFLSI